MQVAAVLEGRLNASFEGSDRSRVKLPALPARLSPSFHLKGVLH